MLTPDETRKLIEDLKNSASQIVRRPSDATIYAHTIEWLLLKAADALAAPLPETGGARERLIDVMGRGEKVRQAAWTAYGAEPDGEGTRPHSDNRYRAEALLAAFPILSRDIAGEIEAENRRKEQRLYEVAERRREEQVQRHMKEMR